MLLNATVSVVLGSGGGAVTLLASSDQMEDEPGLTRLESVQQVRSPRAAAIANIGRAILEHQLSFTRVVVFATDAEARAFLRSHTKAIPTDARAATLTWLGSTGGTPLVDTLASAIVTAFDARTENHKFIARYTLSGGAFS